MQVQERGPLRRQLPGARSAGWQLADEAAEGLAARVRAGSLGTRAGKNLKMLNYALLVFFVQRNKKFHLDLSLIGR